MKLFEMVPKHLAEWSRPTKLFMWPREPFTANFKVKNKLLHSKCQKIVSSNESVKVTKFELVTIYIRLSWCRYLGTFIGVLFHRVELRSSLKAGFEWQKEQQQKSIFPPNSLPSSKMSISAFLLFAHLVFEAFKKSLNGHKHASSILDYITHLLAK